MNQTSTIHSVDTGLYLCRFEVVIFQALQNIVFFILYASVSQTFFAPSPLFTLDTSFSPLKPDKANIK